MPGGIVQNEQLPFAFPLGNGLGKLIQEKLEYIGIDSINNETEESAGLWADRTDHVLADVIAQVRDRSRFAWLRPATSRPRIALDSGFIGEPEFELIGLLGPLEELFFEFRALRRILSFWPGTWDTQIEVQLVQPAQGGAIAQVD